MEGIHREETPLMVIRPLCRDSEKTLRLADVLEYGLAGYDYEVLELAEEIAAADLRGRRLLFAIELGESGINLEYVRLLKEIRLNLHMFDGCVAGVVVDGNSELFTKSVARHLVFSANRAGCTFLGRPLVEGTASLRNYNIIAMIQQTDQYSAYRNSVRELAERLAGYERQVLEHPKILALHAGAPGASNTLDLWRMVREGLEPAARIREISLRNGVLLDCHACEYETCLHYGEQGQCFYGGVISSEVYPAILECDALVMVCPNYNDAVGANLTAFINRLTALFRVHRFYDKRLYAVIVSGYSGSDIVAEQLISALNMNKSFVLPPRFALMRIANDRGAIASSAQSHVAAAEFAEGMMAEMSLPEVDWAEKGGSFEK